MSEPTQVEKMIETLIDWLTHPPTLDRVVLLKYLPNVGTMFVIFNIIIGWQHGKKTLVTHFNLNSYDFTISEENGLGLGDIRVTPYLKLFDVTY